MSSRPRSWLCAGALVLGGCGSPRGGPIAEGLDLWRDVGPVDGAFALEASVFDSGVTDAGPEDGQSSLTDAADLGIADTANSTDGEITDVVGADSSVLDASIPDAAGPDDASGTYPIGAPCQSVNCGIPSGACILQWPAGGYCIAFCGMDAGPFGAPAIACPVGSFCSKAGGDWCYKSCQTDLDCRTGYKCRDVDAEGIKICIP